MNALVNSPDPERWPASFESLAAPDPEEARLPISQYLWILKRQRWKILGFCAAAVILTVIISARLTPVFESTTTVDVDRQTPPGVVGQDAARSVTNDADQYLATQMKLVQSDGVLRPVVDRLQLRQREKQSAAESPRGEAAPIVLKRLRVTRPPNTFSIEPPYGHMLLESLPLLVAVKIVVFRAFGLRDVAWRDIGFADLLRMGAANAGASGAAAAVLRLAMGPAFPRSLLALDFFVCLTLTMALRAAVKSLLEWQHHVEPAKSVRRALIYGAGRTGVATLAEIRAHASIGCQVIGFLDDDPSKRSMRAHGVRVLGGRAELRAVVRKYRVGEVLLALPTASGDQLTGIMEQCQAAGVSVKRVPALLERIGPRVLVKQIREVRLEDLLGRPPARWEESDLQEHLAGRTVVVTGAGGSIGSELCRQIARHRPKTLIGFDQSEAGLYQVEQELREWFPALEFRPAVGSIQNRRRLRELFEEHRPQSVYHAAAYKHVPLMESHLFEAVENNVLGTRNLARAASEHGVEEFVLVSSDKAVRPAGVMGATKRVAEMICQAERSAATRFLAVRFGNVLGSSGSVIPHFRRQIEAGGPVTVTHPDMRRYFMTIPEAAELVLQAATLGSGGEIFVLEMGEPVRILDLARKMVLLSGLRPDIDIPIVFSGTRPGEKLYEEVSALEENTSTTPHAQIRVFSGPAPPPAVLWKILAEMERATQERDPAQVVSCLQKMVPGYTPSGVALREAHVLKRQAVSV